MSLTPERDRSHDIDFVVRSRPFTEAQLLDVTSYAFALSLAVGVLSPSLARPVVIVVAVALSLWLSWRCGTTKAVFRKDDILIHDLWHRHLVPWSGVENFDVETPGRLLPRGLINDFNVVRIRLADGKQVNIYATAMLKPEQHERFYSKLCHAAHEHRVPVRFSRQDLTPLYRAGLSWRRLKDWPELLLGARRRKESM